MGALKFLSVLRYDYHCYMRYLAMAEAGRSRVRFSILAEKSKMVS